MWRRKGKKGLIEHNLDDVGAGRPGAGHAGRQIFEHETFIGPHAEKSGCAQVSLWMRLPVPDMVSGDNDVKVAGKIVASQQCLRAGR